MTKAKPQPQLAETERVDVVLIAEHEHHGELLQPGATIAVNTRQREWLKQLGKIDE